MDPVGRAHARFDRFLVRYLEKSGITPSCEPGCFFCCYAWVEASLGEVEAIRREVSEALWARAVATGRRRAARLARKKADPELPRRHFLSREACPFLEDGRCGVYAARPLACRGVLTDLDPHYCAPGVVPGLQGAERARYLAALDPRRHGPEHYLKKPLKHAREAFFALLEAEASALGFTLAGELTVLAWLLSHPGFRRAQRRGKRAVKGWLKRRGLLGGAWGVYLVD